MANPYTKVYKSIYTVTDLTWFEKLFLCEICSLHVSKGCDASNKYLAGLFGVKSQAICRTVNKLVEKGYLQDKKLNNGFHIPTKKCNQLLQLTVTECYKNSNEMLQQCNEMLQDTIVYNKNTNKKGDKEEAPPPESSNSEKPNLSDDAKNATTEKPNPQKFAPSKEQLMYAIMASMDETHIGRMDASERKNLEKLFYKIRNHLEDIKKNVQKMPEWNVSQMEVIEHFKTFCNNLDDYTKNNNFTTRYLRFNYADLRKKAEQKGRTVKPIIKSNLLKR
jgi:hypothetical protein